ncbi:MAG: hypothetical protein B6I36_00170 [Desulfobacteraceae bacterium 4572_35.1]|nr:MAG: hypothetical protein B6I36_00170 [Desulfobacteraceae bacterium 4572_35.1]
MKQAKFSVEENQVDFLNGYKSYGFKDKSSMLRAAIDKLRQELELETLKRSANLYAEVYSADKELQSLTEEPTAPWPE